MDDDSVIKNVNMPRALNSIRSMLNDPVVIMDNHNALVQYSGSDKIDFNEASKRMQLMKGAVDKINGRSI